MEPALEAAARAYRIVRETDTMDYPAYLAARDEVPISARDPTPPTIPGLGPLRNQCGGMMAMPDALGCETKAQEAVLDAIGAGISVDTPSNRTDSPGKPPTCGDC